MRIQNGSADQDNSPYGSTHENALVSLCKIAEEVLPKTAVSIYQLTSTNYLRQCAGPSIPRNMKPSFAEIPIGDNVGSCGTAAWSGRRIMVNNIEIDQRWRDYRTLPLENGYRACWSEPIKSEENQVIGTVGFYFRRKPSSKAPTLTTMQHVSRVASNLFPRYPGYNLASPVIRKLSQQLSNSMNALDFNLTTLDEEVSSNQLADAAINNSRVILADGMLAGQMLENLAYFESLHPRLTNINAVVQDISFAFRHLLKNEVNLTTNLPVEELSTYVDPVALKKLSLLVAFAGIEALYSARPFSIGNGAKVKPELRLNVERVSDNELSFELDLVVKPDLADFQSQVALQSKLRPEDPIYVLSHKLAGQCMGSCELYKDTAGSSSMRFMLPCFG